MDSDKALELLGERSLWKVGLYCLCSTFMGFVGGWHMMAIVFVGMEPPHHCKLPDGFDVNGSIPEIEKDGSMVIDKCNVWSNYSSATNKTLPCPNGWEYEPPIHSIVNEWDLTCDRGYLVETSQTILVVGVMVGALIMTMLADSVGRKIVFIMCVLCISVCGVLTAFVQHYVAFAIGRFFTGVFQQGVILAGFVYVIELFPASQRTMMGMLCQCFWALGMGIMAGFAYADPNWRHYQLIVSVPGFLAAIMFWVIPESVPWLTAKGRVAHAKRILQSAARVSRVALPGQFRLTSDERAEVDEDQKRGVAGKLRTCFGDLKPEKKVEASPKDDASRYTIMDVIKSRRLLTFAIINAYIWCTNTLVYYGLSLSTGSLSGNPYMNFFLSGLVEIAAYIIAAFALKYIGRRWSIFAFHLLAGIPLFITLFIPKNSTIERPNVGPPLANIGPMYNGYLADANSNIIIGLAMTGKFGITGSFGSIFLWAPELFPTSVRNIGLGIASIGGRIGNLIAPFASFVAKRVSWLPNVVFGVMAILAAILTLFLPETLNRPLPHTIEDVENWTLSLSKEEKQRYKAEKKAMREMKEMNGNDEGAAKEPLNTPIDPVA